MDSDKLSTISGAASSVGYGGAAIAALLPQIDPATAGAVLSVIPAPFNAFALGALILVGVIGQVVHAVQTNKRVVISESDSKSSTPALAKALLLPIMCAALLSACANDPAKQQRLIQIQGNVQSVIVTGCQNAPAIEVALALIQEFLPQGTTATEVKAGLTLGEKAVDQLCAKIAASAPAVK